MNGKWFAIIIYIFIKLIYFLIQRRVRQILYLEVVIYLLFLLSENSNIIIIFQYILLNNNGLIKTIFNDYITQIPYKIMEIISLIFLILNFIMIITIEYVTIYMIYIYIY